MSVDRFSDNVLLPLVITKFQIVTLITRCIINSPFPSCLKPLFQSEAKCEATDMKMIF